MLTPLVKLYVCTRLGKWVVRVREILLFLSSALPSLGRANGKTRGQGPFRPAATRAMNYGQITLKRSIEIRNKLYVFIYKYYIAQAHSETPKIHLGGRI